MVPPRVKSSPRSIAATDSSACTITRVAGFGVQSGVVWLRSDVPPPQECRKPLRLAPRRNVDDAGAALLRIRDDLLCDAQGHAVAVCRSLGAVHAKHQVRPGEVTDDF